MSYLIDWNLDGSSKQHVMYIAADTTSIGGERLPGEKWEREALIQSTTFHYISPYNNTDRMFYVAVPISDKAFKKEKELYLGFVYYSDGDTFGHTENLWEPITAHKTYEGVEYELNLAVNDKKYISGRPWDSVFASLTSKEIIKLPVKYYELLR